MFTIVQVDEATDPKLVGKFAVRNDITGYYLPNDEGTREATFDTIEEATEFARSRLTALSEMVNNLERRSL